MLQFIYLKLKAFRQLAQGIALCNLRLRHLSPVRAKAHALTGLS